MGGTLVVWALCLGAPAPGQESRESFEKLHGLIHGDEREAPWAQIPWMTSVWRARERAAREGKPLFLWAAGGGGHPLGLC